MISLKANNITAGYGGVDIINNSRIKRSITNKKFLTRVFSNTEITNSKKTAYLWNYRKIRKDSLGA